MIRRVQSAAQRALKMTADLLDFARTRAGAAIPISPTLCDLGELAQQIQEELAGAFPERGVHVDCGPGLLAHCDPERIKQALSNLVSNALEHGDGDVDVSLRAEGDEIVLMVHNRGEPIPSALVPTLFQPFSGTAALDGRRLSGLGLGLYIVKQIVIAHGGTISVASSRGEGTTFTARLPRSS